MATDPRRSCTVVGEPDAPPFEAWQKAPTSLMDVTVATASDYFEAEIDSLEMRLRLEKLEGSLNDLRELGLARLSAGDFQEAFACGSRIQLVLQAHRRAHGDRGSKEPAVGEAKLFLFLCHLLTQPYELAVTTASDGDGGTRVKAVVSLPSVLRHERMVRRRLTFASQLARFVFVADWGTNGTMTTCETTMFTPIECQFLLPTGVPDCEFCFYRAGELLGNWRLAREQHSGDNRWILNAQ